VCAADMVITYHGIQRLTPDHSGAAVYGGSDLVVARGGFNALTTLDLPETARRAIEQDVPLLVFIGSEALHRRPGIADAREQRARVGVDHDGGGPALRATRVVLDDGGQSRRTTGNVVPDLYCSHCTGLALRGSFREAGIVAGTGRYATPFRL